MVGIMVVPPRGLLLSRRPPVATVRDDALSGNGDDDTSQAAAAYNISAWLLLLPYALVYVPDCSPQAVAGPDSRPISGSQPATCHPSLHLPAVLRSRPARTPHPCLLASVYTSNHRSCLIATVSKLHTAPSQPLRLDSLPLWPTDTAVVRSLRLSGDSLLLCVWWCCPHIRDHDE